MLKLKPEVAIKYELIIIYNSRQNSYETGLDNTKSILNNNGVEILNEKDMGKKQLAYEVKKNKTGHYVVFELNILPSKVIEIKKEFKLDHNLLKSMFIKLSK